MKVKQKRIAGLFLIILGVLCIGVGYPLVMGFESLIIGAGAFILQSIIGVVLIKMGLETAGWVKQ